jgi:hypothetical protein
MVHTTAPIKPAPAHRSYPIDEVRVSGVKYFSDQPSADDVHQHLEEAHALLSVMSSGFYDADGNSDSTVDTIKPQILGRALEGVQTLITLALWESDQAGGSEINRVFRPTTGKEC